MADWRNIGLSSIRVVSVTFHSLYQSELEHNLKLLPFEGVNHIAVQVFNFGKNLSIFEANFRSRIFL
jgi:hypothetical protein